jgi:gliding motility-associated-like protein
LSVTFSNSIAQAPTATFGVSENSVCAGECIEIENTSQNAATSWVWSFGAGATPSSYSGPDPGPVCFPVAGTYTITLTASNVFGTVSTSQTITVTALPSVSATLSDTTNGVYVEIPDTLINMYQEAYLWAEGVPVGGELIWYPSGVSADGFTVNNGDSVIVNPFYDTYYVVSYSINGCTAYDTVLVNVNYQEIVQVPNSFSPNGDGVNDFLKVLTNVDADNNYTNGFVEGGAIAEIDFRIYNRYGILVFKTSDPHEGWDGTFKGKPENPATFVYTIDYRLINGRSSNLKGNVTLFR